MFNGSIAAIITPMQNNRIDEDALARLVQFHIENGTNAIVAVGTTGEAPTLDKKEYQRVIEVVVDAADGRLPIIAGAGSYNTADAIANTKIATDAGADATLHVVGYYNRPSQEGIFQHFKAVASATEKPILVYNIPPRAIVDIQPETMARLAALPNVVGLKDSTADLSRPLWESHLIEGDFCFLTGEDQLAVAYNAHGGRGCISVTANVAPRLCSDMQKACAEQRLVDARNIQMQLMPLHRALFLEPSPAGVKYACSLLGLSSADCRLPIVELTPETKHQIKIEVEHLGLI